MNQKELFDSAAAVLFEGEPHRLQAAVLEEMVMHVAEKPDLTDEVRTEVVLTSYKTMFPLLISQLLGNIEGYDTLTFDYGTKRFVFTRQELKDFG